MDNEVFVDRDKFDAGHREWEKRTAIVQVPELSEMMGLEEGQVAVIEVQQSDLSTQLWARDSERSISDVVEVLGDYLRGLATRKDLIQLADEETKLTTEVNYQIRLCEKCIIKPEKLQRNELIWISQHFPTVINRVAAKIMEISNLGAVKKNSKS